VLKGATGYIAGGYASVSWASRGGYVADSTAFLFTLTNPSNMPLKLANIDSAYAMYDNPSTGPTFDWDLWIADASNTNTNSYMTSYSYALPNGNSGPNTGVFMMGATHFQVAEIEVFLVT